MDEINYRRFFDINDLAAIRVEDPEVFSAVHALIFDLVRQRPHSRAARRSSGRAVRAREIFPLPAGRLQSLERGFQRATANRNGADRTFYIVAEKILTGNEPLRRPNGRWKAPPATAF